MRRTSHFRRVVVIVAAEPFKRLKYASGSPNTTGSAGYAQETLETSRHALDASSVVLDLSAEGADVGSACALGRPWRVDTAASQGFNLARLLVDALLQLSDVVRQRC